MSGSNPDLICIQVDNKVYSDTNWSTKKDAAASYSEDCSKTTNTIQPPEITATGNQIYCPGTSQRIVETISITNDPAGPDTDALYIQISSGYIFSEDVLTLSNATAHPKISTSWDAVAGKLKLSSPTGAKIPYTDFEAAIKDIQYSNSSLNPTGTRNFSITIGQANYLPSTGHYYEFVPNVGITWTGAKTAAEALNYYGLKGYLATILSLEEAKIAGEQASGAGWIGGSDAETEGVWKWVTGPETGNVFWNGLGDGSTPNFAYWNTNNNEPNNLGDEDFAHITAIGVGIPGSWNDLSNTGSTSGNYQPKGFIVEYGGMPGDPILKISASTSLTVGKIEIVSTPNPICNSGTATFKASANGLPIKWYDSLIGGNLVGTGNDFATPILTSDKSYFADAGCSLIARTEFKVIVNAIPKITATKTSVSICGPGSVLLDAATSSGKVNWYNAPSAGTLLETGNSFTTPNITATTTFYAEGDNNGCLSDFRIPIKVEVYPLPIVSDEEVKKCKLIDKELDAELTGMSYLWSTGAKTQKITVSSSGIYFVDITSPSPEKCTSRKQITVLENNIPEIDRVEVDDKSVIIYLKKEEIYFEYSIDGVNYQVSNVFFNVPIGLQTAYVREIESCHTDKQDFTIFTIKKYFTPNNDGVNDLWEINEMKSFPNSSASIYDRYGKLIMTLNASKYSWDGNFNNNPLPADDYWYRLKLDNSKPEIKGHFSLKR
jgi:gliding motility-associated-like protein